MTVPRLLLCSVEQAHAWLSLYCISEQRSYCTVTISNELVLNAIYQTVVNAIFGWGISYGLSAQDG